MRSALRVTVTFLAMAIITVGVPSATTVWEFDTPGALGVPPSGWHDASQSSPPTPLYRTATFMSAGVVSFETTAGTGERPKIRTNTVYEVASHEWHVFIPPQEANARVSIGAFLYSDQSGGTNQVREIDFEIGPGTAVDRSGVTGLPASSPLCYMTIQRDDISGTSLSSVIYEPINPADHIQPNSWYTLTIALSEDGLGRYVARWFIQRDGGPRIEGRSPHTCEYGPGNAFPTDFRTYCSLENLDFIGDNPTTVNHQVYFDRVTITEEGPPPGPPMVIEDFEAFPLADPYTITASQNSENVSRFGIAYSGAGISGLASDVEDGSQALRIDSSWGAFPQSFVGLRRHLVGSERDWTGATTFSVYARSYVSDGTTIAIGIEEASGEVWRSGDAPLSTTRTKHGWNLNASQLSNADNPGDGVIDLADVAIFDVILRNTSGTGSVAIDRLEMNAGLPVGLTMLGAD